MAQFVEGRVIGRRDWTDRLISLRVEAPVEPFRAGQFTRLALDIDGERIARPYSYVNAPGERPLDFLFIVVPEGPLTTRMARLHPGDPILVAPRGAGLLTLHEIPEARHLWMLSTGTAIGPFLSILKTDEPWQRFERIVLVHAVRRAVERVYREEIADIAARRGGRFAMVPFVSREAVPDVFPGRIPEAIADARLESRLGIALEPAHSQVMVCGNPDMVRDTEAALVARGFVRHKRNAPGQLHLENYWKGGRSA